MNNPQMAALRQVSHQLPGVRQCAVIMTHAGLGWPLSSQNI